ncbi:response regulator [Paenibacillus arenilitoris]|uniref:Response regulator n=1 Tax=Paenibacillus arenilitoris TaxID=2772299 RepID=A0A927CSK3_9BACL|nr:response regulator [Paenibacillus arenilitoris]MBD2870835.1 response regulator [Paenibacillus arenilitoris]
MNPYKVVIVDDEILAIRHLKQLIDWQAHGFEVAGESANPAKALELCHKLKPDLVFVDIRMPVMNGLDFTRRLLEAGFPVKVVLLTSYKEFEYAREAVKLGVVNYMLKHDVQAESLTEELDRIRQELEHERQREGMIRRQLLADMLAGRVPADHQIERLTQFAKSLGDELLLLLLKEDRPFPVLPIMEEAGGSAPAKLRLLPLPHPTVAAVELMPLKAGEFAVLLAVKRMPSRRELREGLTGACRSIQGNFETQNGKTASIVLSRPFARLTELGDAFEELERLRRRMPRTGRSQIRFSDETLPPREEPEPIPAALLDAAASSLEGGDPASVSATMESLFLHAAGDEALTAVCRELLRVLDKFRASHGLAATDKLMADGRIDPACWYRLADIRDWFAAMYREAREEAERHSTARYSKKIRQALAFIHDHYSDELTTESIAGKLGISGDHLRHLFKEETGRTLLDYVTEVRMKKAGELLLAGRHKIYEIAEMVGYGSSQYFSQVFRKKMGVNPLDYVEGRG